MQQRQQPAARAPRQRSRGPRALATAHFGTSWLADALVLQVPLLPPPRDLVIPLTKNPWKREDPGTPPRDNNDDLDEAAAAAVIAEGITVKREKKDLVIAGPSQEEAKAQPLLKAAMLPGLNAVSYTHLTLPTKA